MNQRAMLDYVATQAAQTVGRIHRRRLVLQSFLAALVAAAIVSIGVAVAVNDQRAADSHANSSYNCRTLKTIANVIGKFIQSDADLRYAQQHFKQRAEVIAAFAKIIPPKRLQQIQDDSDKRDTDTQAYWTGNLIPKLEALAEVNCDAVLR